MLDVKPAAMALPRRAQHSKLLRACSSRSVICCCCCLLLKQATEKRLGSSDDGIPRKTWPNSEKAWHDPDGIGSKNGSRGRCKCHKRPHCNHQFWDGTEWPDWIKPNEPSLAAAASTPPAMGEAKAALCRSMPRCNKLHRSNAAL